MELTWAANWLNQTFAWLDYGILEALHQLAQRGGAFFTPFFKGISLLGEGGMGLILLGVVLLSFRRTRRAGLCVLLSLGVGALFTNVIIKNAVARPRPFQSMVEEYRLWWAFVGAPQVSEFSFPSGHTTAATAAMTALFLQYRRPWRYGALAFALIMGLSRNYLMVHYPSDVLAGLLVGAASALIVWAAARKIQKA